MTNSKPLHPPPSHTIADHALGAGFGHVHAPGEDHDHEHGADDNVIAAGSQELARVELVSIGIDIGSSGTQVAFSRLFMHGPGEPAAMRRQLKSRETIFLSPVVLTPFRGQGEIDIERLRGSIARAFEAAGLTPDEIDTGVIIMTGEAARRENSAAIAAALSFEAGDVVAAAAGDHLEAALAAAGSGALERSRASMSRILNVDIGGATTKLAIAEGGRIMATAALKIGGRQMALDAQMRLVRLDSSAMTHARGCGIDWRMGDIVSRADMAKAAEAMADGLFAILRGGSAAPGAASHFVTEPDFDAGSLDAIMFSGGVAEYIYGREARDFGDLGRLLGGAIAARIAAGGLPAPLLPAGECMRATVLGCGEYSVQMSGQTSCITSHAALLPRKNLPVLQPRFDFRGEIDPVSLGRAILRHRAAFGDADPARDIAYAFRWRGDAEYSRVLAFAKGIAAGLADRIAAGSPLYILMEGDVALTLGAILRQELGIANELLAIDGIVLRDFDYVDIGRIRMPSRMVPIIVKTLVFGGQGPARSD